MSACVRACVRCPCGKPGPRKISAYVARSGFFGPQFDSARHEFRRIRHLNANLEREKVLRNFVPYGRVQAFGCKLSEGFPDGNRSNPPSGFVACSYGFVATYILWPAHFDFRALFDEPVRGRKERLAAPCSLRFCPSNRAGR